MNDKRLIEDFLPIEAISKEASREKSVRKGHISTLHLWWARRPLVACRAAVYGALVPASRFIPENGPDNKRQSLGRANAAKFVESLCKYPGNPSIIKQAQEHILDAHADRLTEELTEASSTRSRPPWVEEFRWPKGKDKVTREDIEEGHAPRPRVLDMFAGGGAIPLEALRLGCETYALDLNPVAHIVELCTLVYPQKYGEPDPNARGMTGPKNEKGEITWGGLAQEVKYWGNSVLEKLKAEIGDLYPPIPDPKALPQDLVPEKQTPLFENEKGQKKLKVPGGYLTPVAYLWTRTVNCKNPSCGATVPLVKHTWLCKKKGRYVALKIISPKGEKKVRFDVVEANTEKTLGFDPAEGFKGGNATCPFCGTVADSDYVKQWGLKGAYGEQPMAVVCVRPKTSGKVYLPADEKTFPEIDISQRTQEFLKQSNLTIPDEPLEANPRFFDVQRYGYFHWRQVFTSRQLLTLLAVSLQLRKVWEEIRTTLRDDDRSLAAYTAMALSYSRLVSVHNAFAFVHSGRETLEGPWGDGKFPMSWDFAEANMFSGVTASYSNALNWAVAVHESISNRGEPARVDRGDATRMPFADNTFDAVITDPPYYDSVSYSNLADAFYVWLKRSLTHQYPEHFSSSLTPKKREAIVATYRYGGDKAKASAAYEDLMAESLKESLRVLKIGGTFAMVYAHKTTLGWSTLVDAMRRGGFKIVEAWPLDTEMRGGRKKIDKAMLASSIFLVARKREGSAVGSYEDEVRPDLEKIVRERVDTLWQMGIAGADLVIAAVGAGLRAFTRFASVEYANGEEVPAEKFLAEVEGVVLETMLEKIFGLTGSSVAAVDGATRFYVLWRYTYGAAEMDAGEAIVFTYGQNVELDGSNGLSTGSLALVEKKKGKYRLRDFSERGSNENLGMPSDEGKPPILIDALHRILWLIENEPRNLNRFLDGARPDSERLRVVAQALAGTALAGKKEDGAELAMTTSAGEQAALKKLVANWRALIDQRMAVGEMFPFERKGGKK